jgi:nitroreductase
MKTLHIEEYDAFCRLLMRRVSVRKFKPDPISDDLVNRVLEAGRWAMSGANSQPWEFIVVRDPERRRQLTRAYQEEYATYAYWMEQQRAREYRHPSYCVDDEPDRHKELEKVKVYAGSFRDAPVIIAVLGDGRKQWGTVMGAFTFGRGMTHLTDALANSSMLMHLAAASLGLASQWVTIINQEPFKRILEIPDLLTLYLLIPLGYPATERKPSSRRDLNDLVHYEKYDMRKYMSDEQIIQYLRKLREVTTPKYRASRSLT